MLSCLLYCAHPFHTRKIIHWNVGFFGLNLFLKAVREAKSLKTETISPIGINVKCMNPFLDPG